MNGHHCIPRRNDVCVRCGQHRGEAFVGWLFNDRSPAGRRRDDFVPCSATHVSWHEISGMGQTARAHGSQEPRRREGFPIAPCREQIPHATLLQPRRPTDADRSKNHDAAR